MIGTALVAATMSATWSVTLPTPRPTPAVVLDPATFRRPRAFELPAPGPVPGFRLATPGPASAPPAGINLVPLGLPRPVLDRKLGRPYEILSRDPLALRYAPQLVVDLDASGSTRAYRFQVLAEDVPDPGPSEFAGQPHLTLVKGAARLPENPNGHLLRSDVEALFGAPDAEDPDPEDLQRVVARYAVPGGSMQVTYWLDRLLEVDLVASPPPAATPSATPRPSGPASAPPTPWQAPGSPYPLPGGPGPGSPYPPPGGPSPGSPYPLPGAPTPGPGGPVVPGT